MRFIQCLLVYCLFAPLVLTGQYDQNKWIFGYVGERAYGGGLAGLRFAPSGVDTFYYGLANHVDIHGSGAIIFNGRGNPTAFTNNCHIFSLPDQNRLTDRVFYSSEIVNFRCNEGYYLYYSSVVSLPANHAGNPGIVSQNYRYNFDTDEAFVDTLKSFSLDIGSLGTSIVENVLPVDSSELARLTYYPATSTDGNWIVTTRYTHTGYQAHLVNEDGEFIRTVNSQRFSPLRFSCSENAFSPDGNTYATTALDEGLVLFNFDPGEGLMSGPRFISLPDSANQEIFRGISFSPNSEFVYLNTFADLYQVEVSTGDVTHIANRGDARTADGWPIGMSNMRTGPDCRIYIGPGFQTNVIHVIHSPNEKGTACGFEWGAVQTPTNLDRGFPMLPLRTADMPCHDIPWILSDGPATSAQEVEARAGEVNLYPNPATTEVYLTAPTSLTERPHGRLRLFDRLGRRVADYEVAPGRAYPLDRGRMAAGLYFWRLDNERGEVASGKLVLQ